MKCHDRNNSQKKKYLDLLFPKDRVHGGKVKAWQLVAGMVARTGSQGLTSSTNLK